MTHPLPFTVIGGYLGAGKTTLLNHLLASAAGLRLAVLVNDFGSVNIDASLIRSHDGETIELANGCMCCTLVGGFASAISQVLDRADRFDHLVIEASGVADPAKIAQYGQMYGLPLDGILLVVDAERVRLQAANKYVGDTVLRQFGQADLIVLNKTDLLPAGELQDLRKWLAGVAPGVKIVGTVRAEVPLDVLFGAHGGRAGAEALRAGGYHPDHSHTYGTWTVERADALSREALGRFAAGLGERIFRAKGVVSIEGSPARSYIYQQVGTRWSLEPGDPAGEAPGVSRLVVIGLVGATSAAALHALLAPDVRGRRDG
jgi:G3E family GTPase